MADLDANDRSQAQTCLEVLVFRAGEVFPEDHGDIVIGCDLLIDGHVEHAGDGWRWTG